MHILSVYEDYYVQMLHKKKYPIREENGLKQSNMKEEKIGTNKRAESDPREKGKKEKKNHT